MTECYCTECDWSGVDSVNCPECWGPVLSVEALEERAAIMEFSEAEGVVSRSQSEYWATHSQIKSKTIEPLRKSETLHSLQRWKSFTEPEMRNAA